MKVLEVGGELANVSAWDAVIGPSDLVVREDFFFREGKVDGDYIAH